jgi:hypothetical protein
VPDQTKILAHSKTMQAQNHNSNGDVSYKIKNLSEHKKVSKLTIKNLSYEDEGVYKCFSDGGIQTQFQLELPKGNVSFCKDSCGKVIISFLNLQLVENFTIKSSHLNRARLYEIN